MTDADLDDAIAVVAAAARRLADREIGPELFKNICMSKGITYNRHGILFKRRVRKLIKQGVVTMDWVHSTLCDGAFSCECHLLLKVSKAKTDKGFEEVAAFLRLGWCFPTGRHTQMGAIHRVFSDFRFVYSENHEKLKASASELLCVYGLLRHWVLIELGGDERMTLERLSFEAACDIVDILLETKQGKYGMKQGAELLIAATESFLKLHQQCYGKDHIKPKHHWLFDIALQWLSHLYVLDAFVIEKEHLAAKPIADRTDNTIDYEASVLAGMLHSQVESLGRLGPRATLIGKSAPLEAFDDARVCDRVEIDGVPFVVGDFVHCESKQGKVVACCEQDDDLFLIIDVLVTVERLSKDSGIYAFDGRRVVWDARNLSLALAWRSDPRGLLVINR